MNWKRLSKRLRIFKYLMKKHRNKLSIVLMTAIVFWLSVFQSKAITRDNSGERKSFQFINGRWFDGKKFRHRVFYSVNGFLVSKKPSKIDETIDLKDGYAVPPFADAHCHHFDSSYNAAQQINMYLQNGVFYAKVQTDVLSGALQIAGLVNKPTSVDVSYAHGALTHSYGHGIEVYEGLALGYFFDPKLYKENINKIAASRLRENDAYYIIDTANDLESKWRKILDGKPDFIKIYLLTSENFPEKLKNIDKIPLGSIGLNPELVPAIVQKAHAAGLRVSAHVDTEKDFRVALEAGVDEMAHLPGYYISLEDKSEKYMLSEKDAKEAADRKIWVIPAPVFYGSIDQKVREKTDVVLKHNLQLLKKYRVQIAFGSDSYGRTSVEDVLYLSKTGVFNNLETLKIWTEETPRTIFPGRKIGKLKDGYEASFIVLEKNPVENFENIKTIWFRFKQGSVLKP